MLQQNLILLLSLVLLVNLPDHKLLFQKILFQNKLHYQTKLTQSKLVEEY